jgi:hypothetical protein
VGVRRRLHAIGPPRRRPQNVPRAVFDRSASRAHTPCSTSFQMPSGRWSCCGTSPVARLKRPGTSLASPRPTSEYCSIAAKPDGTVPGESDCVSAE